MRHAVAGLFAILLLDLATTPAFAQKQVWDGYDKYIVTRSDVGPLGADLFGDTADLYNGRLSFRHVDIDIPGNSALPVRLARSFVVTDGNGLDHAMSDWDIELPRISGVFAETLYEWMETTHWTWGPQRCSGPRVPPVVGPFFPVEYWQGTRADIPGGGELLEPSAATRAPTSGGPWRWVTAGFTWLSCLAEINNGEGEGFLAVTTDGTKYWFNWMAMFDQSALDKTNLDESASQLIPKRYALYATRVEDRFGNWVNYSYGNAATEPVRLSRIESNDGRRIDLGYNTQGFVSSATDGTRTWTYDYAVIDVDAIPVRSLVSVLQPDGSGWSFNLADLAVPYSAYQPEANCENPAPTGGGPEYRNAGSIRHPSGALGEFEVSLMVHGRSDVPRYCAPVYGGSNYSDYVRNYWLNSLVLKRISGPGLPTMQWDYTYNNSDKPTEIPTMVGGPPYYLPEYHPPGSWAPAPYTYQRIEDASYTYIVTNPVCVSEDCADRITTDVVGPGGEWMRYTFGNSYRYNEHKLLGIDRGTGPGAIVRSERFSYELARQGQPFPIPVGLSRQYKGDAMVETELRPLKTKVITQDGVNATSVVNAFDEFGRPVNLTKSSSPVQ